MSVEVGQPFVAKQRFNETTESEPATLDLGKDDSDGAVCMRFDDERLS